MNGCLLFRFSYLCPKIKKNMNFRRLLLILGGCAFSACILAQPKIEAEHDAENLGEIMFQVPAKVVFKVRNTGNEDLVIKEVNPSCGCVVVDWNRESIPPGNTATINAIYDAKMLGVFQKDIEVFTNVSENPVYLHFQGRVVKKVTDFSGAFPYEMGDLRLTANKVEFENVNKGDQPIVELQVLNRGRKSYQPRLMHLPSYLTARYSPEVLAGGRIGKIELTLNSEKLNTMGLTQTSVYLSRYEGDHVSDENEIAVSILLLPDFSSMTAKERALAPRMDLSADLLDMGTLSKRRKTMSLYIKNTGQQMLDITGLQMLNKALTVSLSNKNIEPGGVARMKVSVDAEYLVEGDNELQLLLIVNDPFQPMRTVTIKVNKEKNQERWSIRKIVQNIRD